MNGTDFICNDACQVALFSRFWWGHAPPRSQVDQLVRVVASFEVPVGVGNVTPQDAADALLLLLAVSWQATA
ncbi:MAG: hypothetical protein ABW121_03970 [Candidatus Thiodiazotropha sp. 6PLUC7]